jgi:hypothetical protein
VRHEAPCCIPNTVGRNLEEYSWVRWLTRIRKMKGTRACHQVVGIEKASKVGRHGTRVIWRKLDCLNPNLQKVKVTDPPERRLEPVSSSASA